ncbi:MAG: class I SAM-dependent methyltransferase [Hyphomicrobiaceae bacterium]
MNKSLVRQQFGSNAANYVDSVVHAKGASLAKLVDVVQPQTAWHGLDVATGAGHTAFAFAPHVSKMLATDLTEQMLEQVRKQISTKGHANVETALADAEALPFEDSSFDLVTCRIAPHHFPSIPAFVDEIRRVLKSGGIAAIVDNVSPDQNTTPGFSDQELDAAATDYNDFEKLRDPSHVRAWTVSEWLTCIADAGLDVFHFECLDKAMSFNAWCRNQSVPNDLEPVLSDMLTKASPAFAEYIRPHPLDHDDIGFVITELLVVARKPHRS